MNPSRFRTVVATGQCPPQEGAISSPLPQQRLSSASPARPPDPTKRAAQRAIRQPEKEIPWHGSPRIAVLRGSAKIAGLRTSSYRRTRSSAIHSRSLRGGRQERVLQGWPWRRADERVNRG